MGGISEQHLSTVYLTLGLYDVMDHVSIQIKRTPYMKVFLALEKLSEDVVGTAS
jgi:hypothetical protein